MPDVCFIPGMNAQAHLLVPEDLLHKSAYIDYPCGDYDRVLVKDYAYFKKFA